MAEKEKKQQRPYPRVPLESALRVAIAIKDKNAGNPWQPDQVAQALGVGSKTGNYFYLTAGSRDYGLTTGSRDSETISLTELGKSIVYAANPEQEYGSKLTAFLNIKSFKGVLDYYKGNKLPEKQYLSNVLQNQFGILPEFHDEFVEVFQANCKYLGIGPSFSVSSSPQSGLNTNITLAVPGTPVDGKLCFIIMPFVERDEIHASGFFSEVLNSLLVPAAKACGFIARTANRSGSDVIQSTIVNDLLKADLVIADLTEHNPNVLFELGMRMREDKPVALVKAKGTGRIFDVDNLLRVYEYDSCLWPSTVSKDLPEVTNHIQAAWDNRDTGLTYMKLLKQSPAAVLPLERQY